MAVKEELKTGPKKVLAMSVHLYAGVDLMGSKTSMHHKESEIEVLPHGVLMTSKKVRRSGDFAGTCRRILIPYSNVKGIELLPDNFSEPKV